ncbi:MAG: hypothetical protein Q4A37_02155 [Candidatus Saccharibacteria bacterium]|nr:hypothetical protein [Candidatus Saccharibacteria bacterium]
MTSLSRLRQAMNHENGRPPVLPPDALRASLGQYGVSAAEQLLSSSGVSEERHVGGSGLDAITNPEIKARFEQDYATYRRIFEGGDITLPTPEELASGGIDWVRLAELKETRPDHDLVVAPLTLPLAELRQMVSSVTNDRGNIRNNPLKSYSLSKEDSDGLWVNSTVVDHWDGIMAATAQEWQLPVALVTKFADSPVSWTAFLLSSSQNPEHRGTSFQDMQQQNIPTTSIVGYITYQMKRIAEGLPPVDSNTWTWAQGEFRDMDGAACAPFVIWIPARGQVDVHWGRVGISLGIRGVRSPVG